MYADDTSITFAGSDVDEINSCINLNLERIRVWLAANKLTLNMTMTEFLLIGSKQNLLNFTANPTANINQFPIKRVSTVKSLGVDIDENLTWECHINDMSFLKRLLPVLAPLNVLGIRSHIRLYFPFTIH